MASGAPGWISTSRGSNTYDYWPRNQVRKTFFLAQQERAQVVSVKVFPGLWKRDLAPRLRDQGTT